MSIYFPKPKPLGAGNVDIELYLSNYVKNRFKNATGIDASDFTKKG